MAQLTSAEEWRRTHIGGADSIRMNEFRLSNRHSEITSLARECTMIDWDDVRYFLAVARGGSVRSAAARLAVNHATVLRRVAQLEDRLGVRMFEKLPSGYRLTAAGEEILEFAEQMEASSHKLETRVFGRDQSVRGLLRVTLPPPFTAHLLMPDFADFTRLHPDIEMEFLSTGELANLTNRQADVAIRVAYDRETLPLNLHGLKGPEVFGGFYMARTLSAARHDPIRWIAISGQGVPGLGPRGRGPDHRRADQDYRFRDANRGGSSGTGDHHAALFRRRCRSPSRAGTGK